MTRIAVVMTSALLNASTIPAVASECTSSKDIAASRARWATVRSQSANTSDNETNCHAYAVSFYESVTLRQAAVMCIRDADYGRTLAELDSEIDAFNNLLATKCGG